MALLGIGTGITAGAALLHPVDHIVALEIVPEVAIAARQDFADVNSRVMDDPRVRVVIDDGRNYLASSPRAFDVIVGDLLVPWRPAEAPLYTQEHFESVRRALTAEGVFCQWLPLYQLSPEQLAIILRTFLDVFPEASLWRGNFIPDEPTLALVGHLGSRPLQPEAIDARVQALAASTDSNPFLAHPAGMWLFLVGPLKAGMPWFAGAPRNRDGEPWIELLSPVSHAGRDHAVLGQGRVTPLLEQVAEAPLEGTPLRSLDDQHRAWRAAGAALSRASEIRTADGEQRVLAILRTLPPELQRALDVDRYVRWMGTPLTSAGGSSARDMSMLRGLDVRRDEAAVHAGPSRRAGARGCPRPGPCPRSAASRRPRASASGSSRGRGAGSARSGPAPRPGGSRATPAWPRPGGCVSAHSPLSAMPRTRSFTTAGRSSMSFSVTTSTQEMKRGQMSLAW